MAVALVATLAWGGPAVAGPKLKRTGAHCPALAAHARRPALHAGCVIETGIASWYGEAHDGLPTASGELFDMNLLTAAHASLPMYARVRVICVRTGRSVVVRINDRLPASAERIIDLSKRAAALIGMKARGVAKVRLVLLKRGET